MSQQTCHIEQTISARLMFSPSDDTSNETKEGSLCTSETYRDGVHLELAFLM